MPSIHAGAVAPYKVELVVTGGTADGDGSFDLSAVTAGTIKAKRESGSILSWSASLSAQTVAAVTLTYTFTSGDVYKAETLKLWAELTTPGGTLYTGSDSLTVYDYPS